MSTTSAGAEADATISESVVHLPPPRLRPFVERAVGYRLAGFPAGTHRGLPSRHLTVVLPFDEPLRTSWLADPTGSATSFDALVGGLHRSPALIHHDGDQHGIQLDLTPAGARTLLGLPARALVSTDVELAELWPGAAELRDRLERCPSWSGRFTLLDAALETLAARCSHRRTGIRPETAAAWCRLAETDGAIGVAALAAEVGWSRRHLADRFRAEFGLSPKVAGRVMRFERSRVLLVRDGCTGLADVAARCGYADQAHMARDWSELAGASPTAWLAGESLPVLHADAGQR